MSEKLGINPFLYMLVSPRKTVRAICNYEPKKGLFFLSTIVALHYAFLYLSLHPLKITNYLFAILPLILILSPILGWIWINFQAWALLVTGKFFKGKAHQKDLLVAVAWSKLPLIATLFLWLILMVFAWYPFFSHYFSGISLIFIGLIASIAFIWSVVLYVSAVQEVQGFSLFESLLNICAAFMLMTLIIMSAVFLYYYLIHMF